MGYRGGNGREEDSFYSEQQVRAVTEQCGIEWSGDTELNFYGMCPFHGNTDTHSFTISKEQGVYFCFNPSCAATGNLVDLVVKLLKINHFAAVRLIKKHEGAQVDFGDRLARELAEEPEWEAFDVDLLRRAYNDFWQADRAQEYMRGRKFEDETLKHFRIGYSVNRDSIMVPMHSPDGLPIGFIGRSIEGKEFKNSKGLPKNKTAWNYHRAKRQGDTVIICEASFDAMRIHQAGYPNVVALLGGNFSDYQQRQLGRAFNTIVIMTDNDKPQFNKVCAKCKKEGANLCKGHNPGEDLGKLIATKMTGKRVLWAHCGLATRFPPGVKDAGDMTDTEIRHCINNAISHIEYAFDY